MTVSCKTAPTRLRSRRRQVAYFDLAHRLIHPPPPKLVAVGGLSGTGKSVLGAWSRRGIEPQPGAVVLRSDIVRKQQFHASETDRLPPEAYRPEATRKVYAVLADRAANCFRRGIPWLWTPCLRNHPSGPLSARSHERSTCNSSDCSWWPTLRPG